jgi:exopolysaccharide biosynthesis polyprenyl glycosylphosphotransferase
MSTMEIFAGKRGLPRTVGDERAAVGDRAAQLLPALAGMGLFAIDVAVILGAFVLAYWARSMAPNIAASEAGLDQYARAGLTVSLATALLFALNGLYNVDRPRLPLARLHLIASGVSTALVLAVTVSYVFGNELFPRLGFAAGWAFSVVGLVIWRAWAQAWYPRFRATVAPANRVLIVGANPLGQEVASELAGSYQVVGYVDNGTDLGGRLDYPHLGSIAKLERLVQVYAIDELVIALPANRREQIGRIIDRGFRRPVKIKLVPDQSELLPQRVEVERIGTRSYIGFSPVAPVSFLKRAADILISGIALLALAPVFAAIAIAIKLDCPGPVFYRQLRVGKDGTHFLMLKFRSMRPNADRLLDKLRQENEATGPLFKMRNDPRITRVGRVLRRLSLDELPQLFNVLKGEMSLVGPRPPIPSEVAEYEDWQFGRLRAVPGITGLWQVSGRSDVPFHDMVRLDLHYIRNWSLALDLEILLRTIPAVLTSRGAY